MEQGYLKSKLLYAPKKGVFYWIDPPSRHAHLLGEEAGSPGLSGAGKMYHSIKVDGNKYKRSRLAFLYMTGSFPPEMMDHINGNSLDDRWLNLRAATATQNAQNHKGRKKQSNLPMGIRRTSAGRFSARIGCDGQQHSLGTFDQVGEAVAAYKIARKKFFNEFA